MCFFNRLRFTCGHQQYAIFQPCALARFSRPLTKYYHTTCRPQRHLNFRRWELNGPCEGCRRYSVNRDYYRAHDLQATGCGWPTEGFYPYYPGGGGGGGGGWGWGGYPYRDGVGFARRSSGLVSPINPDLCDDPNCGTITTPKNISEAFLRTRYGRPHTRPDRLLGAVQDPWSWRGDGDFGMGFRRGGEFGFEGSVDGFGGVPMRRSRSFTRSGGPIVEEFD
ncbi:hypothetical protein ABW19_dt0204530 [Dactylella cylindrospora]|nr:hypothetical protein ABW19_dt0204530 [Dactylella cylindrospora]